MILRLNKNALTLTELLVSSFLMGIVMIGIAGFSVTLKKMQDTTDKQAVLAMQVAAAMAFMERGITQTFGSQAEDGGATCNEADSTWCSGTGGGTIYWSFRTDPAQTPSDYTDDVWFIIYRRSGGANQDSIFGCTQNTGTGSGQGIAPIRTPASRPCGANNRFTVLYRKLDRGDPNKLVINFVTDNSPSNLTAYVEVTLNAKFNPTAVIEPIDNPSYSMTTRIALPQYTQNPTN